MKVYAVTVGVALHRPPAIHQYRHYVLAAPSPLQARLLATQWATERCDRQDPVWRPPTVMPVYASHPEPLQ